MTTDAGRTALVVRGGWDGHHPVAATELFIPHLEASGFSVHVVDGSTAVYADAGLMDATDLVVQCVSMATVEPDELAGLRAAVAAGTGLAGWHGGVVDSYRDPGYAQLVGGQFLCHPGVPTGAGPGAPEDPQVRHRVEVLPAAADHPVTTGIDGFDLVTEQYWVMTDDLVDVLATTTVPVRAGVPWHRPVTSPAV